MTSGDVAELQRCALDLAVYAVGSTGTLKTSCEVGAGGSSGQQIMALQKTAGESSEQDTG